MIVRDLIRETQVIVLNPEDRERWEESIFV